MRRFTPLTAGLTAALIFTLSVAAPGMAATPPQVALGISEANWYDVDNSGNDAVDAVTSELGYQPAIWSVWSDWGNPNTGPFPTAVVDGLAQKGVVPQVYWEPTDPSVDNGLDCSKWSLSTIISGSHDDYIKAWAAAAAADGNPIILRFAHEMNGRWYVWGNGVCDNTSKKFRQAWKHVWNIFHAAGATNVKFEYSIINTQYVSADYPGNKYVDYFGFTALDWGTKKKWKPLDQLVTPAVTALRKLSKTKPIIASEIGAGYNASCAKCDKAAFFSQGYPAMVAKFPQIVAIVYFDYDMRGVGQDDWRLQSPQPAMDAYKALLEQSQFRGSILGSNATK